MDPMGTGVRGRRSRRPVDVKPSVRQPGPPVATPRGVVPRLQRLEGGPDCRAGGYTVIDEDDRSPFRPSRCAIPQVNR